MKKRWMALTLCMCLLLASLTLFSSCGADAGEEEITGTDETADTGVKQSDEACRALFDSWLLSLSSLDYGLHFSLFVPEALEETVYADFRELGLSGEAAVEKIQRVVKDIAPFTECSVEYELASVLVGDKRKTEAFLHSQQAWFERVGINVAEIETCAFVTVESLSVYFDNMFMTDEIGYIDAGDEIPMYCYRGTWYVDHNLLDDDTCIDPVQSEPGETNGYYTPKSVRGTVTALEGRHIRLDDRQYFLLSEGLEAPQIGASVEIQYYSFYDRFTRIADGLTYQLAMATAITSQAGSEPEPTNSIKRGCLTVRETASLFSFS